MTDEVARLSCQGKKKMTLAQAEREARKRKVRIYRCHAQAMEPPHFHVTSNLERRDSRPDPSGK